VDAIWILFGVVSGLAIIVLIVVFPIVAFFRARSAAKMARQVQDNWQKLTQRVHALETQLQDIKRLNVRTEILEQQVREIRAGGPHEAPAAAGPSGPPKPAEGVADAAASQTAVADAGARLVAGTASEPAAPPAAPPAVETPPQAIPPAKLPARPGITGPPYVSPASATASLSSVEPPHLAVLSKPKPTAHETAKRIWNIEEVLGTDWLNKLGMIILVIGVALFLGYEMRELGPAGKVLVGFAVSGGFLGAGIFFERKERWQILARAAMGGGWALLYFTTYAMNHIGAARVLESESWDFVLLMIVAAAMVGHTLRYRSRVITGLAFLLAFSTINISHAGATSLLASAILAVALVVIVGKRRWFDLEVLAIVAIFLNHYYWLRPIIEPMGKHHHAFPGLAASTALLMGYWLIFRFSYIFRRIDAQQEENISTMAAILNTFLFHFLVKYQSVHPELAFWFLLGVGTVELVLGQLPVTRRRRTAFVILSTLGATLLVAAFPYRYSGGQLSVIWLAEAEAFFLAGVFTREILFRWLGIAAEVLVAGHMFFVDTRHLLRLREAQAADFSDPRRAAVFALAALVIFANTHWVPRHWPDLVKSQFEKRLYRFQSYLGGFMLLAALWAVCTESWLAVAFAGAALVLAIVGDRWKIGEISVLANTFAVLGFLRVVFANFAVVEVSYFNARAVLTICLAAALLYLASRWIAIPTLVRTYRIPEAYTWVATFVVALLAWYQLWPASVAMGWALIGLVLFQLGFERRSASLRWQSYALFLASFFRLFFVNFNAEMTPGQLSPRLLAALPLAIVFYFVYGRLGSYHQPFLTTDARLRAAGLHCYLGTLTVAAAMRFELDLDWIAAAWAALALLFVLIAWRTGRRIFLGQAMLLAAGNFFRTVFHNFYERSYFPPPTLWAGRWMTVGTSILLLFLALMVARQLQQASPKSEGGRIKRVGGGIERNPEQVFFFAAFIILTGLLYLELHARGMATVAWGAEAVGVFLFALAVKERSFRLSALTLLLICVGKIVFVDVWGLAARDRYLTFIALGAALLSVSFLYTRYKEVIRAYL